MIPANQFQLGEWWVEPTLNRLTRGDTEVHVEPKMMDVLTFLWSHAGQVVTKNEILDAVWSDVVTTEGVVTRAIAGLRRALDDHAATPRFIETISKRGYRLIPPGSGDGAPGRSFAAHSQLVHTAGVRRNPYVVGQWVRAQSFYGRTAEIDEILHGQRNWIWLLGMRRVGKTSLLKQLEHLALTAADGVFVPVFWDLQGCDDPAELHIDFRDAVLDAVAPLAEVGIEPDEVMGEDVFESLGRIRRRLRAKQRSLLLLCDEAEQLIRLEHRAPGLLCKLRRALQAREGIRSVLASGNALWGLARIEGETSPFLDGFSPPLFLGPLTDAESDRLICQAQLPDEVRPLFSEDDANEISVRCGNHPFLLQIACSRFVQGGDLKGTFEDIEADRSVSYFCSVDFGLLDDGERTLVTCLVDDPGSAESVAERTGADRTQTSEYLAHLAALGVVRRTEDGCFEVRNPIFERWLRDAARRG